MWSLGLTLAPVNHKDVISSIRDTGSATTCSVAMITWTQSCPFSTRLKPPVQTVEYSIKKNSVIYVQIYAH